MKDTRIIFIVVSAVLSFLCFPPMTFGPLIFMTLTFLLMGLEDMTPAEGLQYGFLWGLIFYLGLMYYIAWVTIPGMIGAVIFLSMITAVGLWLYVFLKAGSRSMALVFFVSYFISCNWLLTKSDLNYPWTDLGYALGYFLPMIQAAEIGGVYLISSAILIVNVMIYISISPKFDIGESFRVNLRYGSILLIAALYFYGEYRLPDQDKGSADGEFAVAVLQGNMTRDIKWRPENLRLNFDRYFELSRRAALDGAELIIWPETATPTYLAQERDNLLMFREFVDSLGVSILTGTPYYEITGPREYVFYNSAIMLEPSKREFSVYSKIHLVPFSERIPFSGRFKRLKEIRLGQADFSSGKEQVIFDLDGYKFGTVICFESAFPGYCRDFARKGAQFLVVITNDMWFGRTSLLEQHAMMSVFRAIESRIPVARSANTGVSMAVDKWGRILKKSDVFRTEYLTVKINPEGSRSVYGEIGDVIPKSTLAILVLSLIVAFWRRYRYNREV